MPGAKQPLTSASAHREEDEGVLRSLYHGRNGGIASRGRFLSSHYVLLSQVDRKGMAVLELWKRAENSFISKT